MKLRARVTLIACGCFATLALMMAIDGGLQRRAITKRYEETLVTGHRNAWAGITDAEHHRLAALVAELGRNDAAVGALARRDRAGFAAALGELRQRLQADPTAPVLEAATPDGTLFFSTDQDAADPTVLSPEVIAAATAKLALLSGLARPRRGHLALTVVAPLLSRDGVCGVVALSIDLVRPLAIFAASVGYEAFIVDGAARLEHATQPALWPIVAKAVAAARDEPFSVVRAADRVFSLVRLPVNDLLARPSMTLLASRDITAAYWRERLLGGLSQSLIALALAFAVGVLYWYMRRSFRPLNAIIGALNALARGDTGIVARYPARDDEIGRLAGTVEAFRQGQQARGQLLAFRQELDMAARIQRSILPSTFPVAAEFSLAACLQTAREVGGDFYDFFTLPDGRLALIVADVSDKGLAAALFMAVARTALRSIAMIVPEPAACLARANDLLSAENDAAMFVTVFYGVFDPASGRLRYANGGHNPPALLDVSGQTRFLEGTDGMALGVMSEIAYAERDITLTPGDCLLLYTDGATDAIDERARVFATDGLREALESAGEVAVDELVRGIAARVQQFAGNAPQFDDITLMALRYRGGDAPRAAAAAPAFTLAPQSGVGEGTLSAVACR
ncbi:MAG: SpoIIE family protein phosphatase [Candidatus Competibacteraceae bacterium]|nr:SpoIIE family protein phosphatase [Candidatus Competibacteraceae bacterium]